MPASIARLTRAALATLLPVAALASALPGQAPEIEAEDLRALVDPPPANRAWRRAVAQIQDSSAGAEAWLRVLLTQAAKASERSLAEAAGDQASLVGRVVLAFQHARRDCSGILYSAYKKAGPHGRLAILRILVGLARRHGLEVGSVPRVAALCRSAADSEAVELRELAQALASQTLALPPARLQDVLLLGSCLPEGAGGLDVERLQQLAKDHPPKDLAAAFQTADARGRTLILRIAGHSGLERWRADRPAFELTIATVLRSGSVPQRAFLPRVLLLTADRFRDHGLSRLLRDEHTLVRQAAARACGGVAGPVEGSLVPIRALLKCGQGPDRRAGLAAVFGNPQGYRGLLAEVRALHAAADEQIAAEATAAALTLSQEVDPRSVQQLFAAAARRGETFRDGIRAALDARPSLLAAGLAGQEAAALRLSLNWFRTRHRSPAIPAPTWERLLGHPDLQLRQLVVETLRYDAQLETLPEALGELLRSPQAPLRAASLKTLAHARAALGAAHTNELARLLLRGTPAARQLAAQALRRSGKFAGEVVPQLFEALEGADGVLARRLIDVLLGLDEAQRPLLRARRGVIQALAERGPRMARDKAQELLDSLR